MCDELPTSSRHFAIDDRRTIEIRQELIGDVNCVVWDSALVAVHAFIHQGEQRWKGKKVLELGAGTGVCGLILSALGADVVLTDLPDRLSLIESNIAANSPNIYGSVTCKPLDWLSPDVIPPVHTILLVDCVYYKSSVLPLIEVLRQSSANQIICLYEKRDVGEPVEAQAMFLSEIGKHFNVDKVPDADVDPCFYCPDDIPFLLLTKK